MKLGDDFSWDLFLSGYIVSAPISCKVNKTVTPTVYVVWKNHFCFERSTVQKQPSTSVLQINFSDIFKKTGKMVIPTTVQKQQLDCLESTLHVNALKCCWNLKIKTYIDDMSLKNLFCNFIHNLTNIYLFKFNSRSYRKSCEICLKLTIKAPGHRWWRLG